ncbi:hypothetical protein CAOG_06278 [Capsaspora owczarzaki ATCC 30864]|uniref:hypothetical protein n=1 Tax=Capsaspora owczarzaki (strain ATCC 30864) TaxID=595528 RepID=UPI0003521CD1|nr:hypothetical protein CAOG_06278 [Capsaspora owczarzaki ATCC 30864]|eukprot:XP_004345027.2 hypothetical protein CAOG_06278 [Capsaspora owczarzaki ATCC 30864]
MADNLWSIQRNLIAASPALESFVAALHSYTPAAASAASGTTDNAAQHDAKSSAAGTGSATTAAPTTRKFKWATSMDSTFKFDHATAIPHPDIADIQWSTDVIGVDRSEGGAGGVFFVQTKRGAVVIKASRTLAPELFASLLCLRLQVAAPRSRVVSTSSEEGAQLLASLKQVDPSWRVITNLFDQACLLVQDYIPGTVLSGLDYTTATAVFGSEVEDNATPEEAERIRSLGRLLVVDTLLNNGDRLPLFWDNQGNPSNIMISRANAHSFVSIDTRLTGIAESSPLLAPYISRVAALTARVLGKNDKVLDAFSTLRQLIASYIAFDIGEKGARAMQEGFESAVRECIAQRVAISSEMRRWAATFHEIGDGQHHKFIDTANLNLDFVDRVLDAFENSQPK